MATYIVNWNPERWHWENHAEFVAKTQAGQMPVFDWSTGNRKNVDTGDRLFLLRQADHRGIIGSGHAVGPSYRAPHWDESRDDEANVVDIRWDTVLNPSNVYPVAELTAANLGVPWAALLASGVQVPAESEDRLERLWQAHLRQLKQRPIPFVVGNYYTRQDIYEILEVPEDKRRGNWETGYTRWDNDLFMFPTVGSAATGGYDYDNGWEGEIFRWYAKENTRLDQPQVQWILNEAERVFIFTRPAVRTPFTFQGLGAPVSWEDTSPVLIRWKIDKDSGPADFAILPNEELTPSKFIEGAVRVVSVNAYERNPRARRVCVAHYGYLCGVCGFSFAEFYGELGEGFIHVHHLRDLATIGAEYEVDPIRDLRPVCPNCHAMLHRQTPAMSIEALRAVIAAKGQNK